MNYHNILKENMNNGDGLRTVLFVSGCPHHCKGCQNPQTWDRNSGIEFDDGARNEIFETMELPWIGGITISGGEPLADYNLEEVMNLCQAIKLAHKEKTIIIYTGYTLEELTEREDWRIGDIISHIDTLITGRYIEERKSPDLKWVGSDNQIIYNFKKTRGL